MTIIKILFLLLFLAGTFWPNCANYTASFGFRLLFLAGAIMMIKLLAHE